MERWVADRKFVRRTLPDTCLLAVAVGSTGEICLIESGNQAVVQLVSSVTRTFLILDSDCNLSATLVFFLYSSIA